MRTSLFSDSMLEAFGALARRPSQRLGSRKIVEVVKEDNLLTVPLEQRLLSPFGKTGRPHASTPSSPSIRR